jgi:hypothetical protein
VSALGGTDPTSIFNERQDVTPRVPAPRPPNSTAPPDVKPFREKQTLADSTLPDGTAERVE